MISRPSTQDQCGALDCVNAEPPDPTGRRYGNGPQTLTVCLVPGEEITLSGGAPPAGISINGAAFEMQANLFSALSASSSLADVAAAKAEANEKAYAFLTSWVAEAQLAGRITCAFPPLLDIIYLLFPDAVNPGVFTISPNSMVSALGVMYAVNNTESYSSADGLTWAQIGAFGGGVPRWIAYGQPSGVGSPLFAVMSFFGGGAWTSPDGAAWTPQVFVTAQVYSRMTCGDLFMACADAGRIAWSNDGVTWNEVNTGFAGDYRSIAYGGGVYVVVGDGGEIRTSPDGVIWTTQISGTANDLYDVCYGGAQFVAVGLAGTILTSPTGVVWTAQTGDPDDLQACAYGNGSFITFSTNNSTFTSTDGINWTSARTAIHTSNEGYAAWLTGLTFCILKSDTS